MHMVKAKAIDLEDSEFKVAELHKESENSKSEPMIVLAKMSPVEKWNQSVSDTL